MKDALISIIIPCYNGEKYLSQSIGSCLNQTYKNIELIIVNDCSTDKSLSIIETFARNDSRIKVINNKENKKLPTSLNIGHQVAKGEYITWTSDDNILKPNFIEFLFDILDREQADVVYSNYDIIQDDGSLKRKHIAGPTEHLLYGNKVGASFLYKREVFQTLKGYDENLYLLEDYDFWLRASLKFKFYHLNDNLYQYRLDSTSLTSEIQNNKIFNNQHKNGYILMFSNIAINLGWNDITRDLLINNNLKVTNSISDYILYKKIIKKDILKIVNKDLDANEIIFGLLLNLRNKLINDNQNYNLSTFFNVLRNEKLLLFHKSFSKKATLNYFKNCIINK